MLLLRVVMMLYVLTCSWPPQARLSTALILSREVRVVSCRAHDVIVILHMRGACALSLTPPFMSLHSAEPVSLADGDVIVLGASSTLKVKVHSAPCAGTGWQHSHRVALLASLLSGYVHLSDADTSG